MQKIMACVGIVGVMVVGAMSKDMFWASLPIAIGQGDSAQTLQDILDGIMPGMLGMAAFWLYYCCLLYTSIIELTEGSDKSDEDRLNKHCSSL